LTTVIISAAGIGSRLGLGIPKCLVPFRGAAVIDHLLALMPAGTDVRIVVGFKEAEVMAHVSRHWPDVTFVRNPSYATTSNSYSLHLASRHLRGPFISVDGDMLIEPASFDRFLAACAGAAAPIVGIAQRTSEEAVAVKLSDDGMVTSFLRAGAPGYEACTMEWCGVALFAGTTVAPNPRFVFEELSRHLPLRTQELICREIDTPADLEAALAAFPAPPKRLDWMTSD
jgi:choline kinase